MQNLIKYTKQFKSDEHFHQNTSIDETDALQILISVCIPVIIMNAEDSYNRKIFLSETTRPKVSREMVCSLEYI